MESTESREYSGPIRVVLADDHDMVRSGIKALLDRLEDVEVVGEAEDGEGLLATVASTLPHVVMTDLSMPGMDGIELIGELTQRHPDVRVIVLSMHKHLDFVRRAVAAGACAYLMKDSPPSTLEQAVRSVMEEGSYFEGKLAQSLVRTPRAAVEDELTFRQMQILTLLAQGRSSKEIAYELGLSSKTIDVHRARIMSRLQLNDLASLTRYAVRKGLVKL